MITSLSNNPQADDISKKILEIIDEKNPRDVGELIRIVKERLDLKEEKIVETVLRLQAEGAIKLENQCTRLRTLWDYLKTSEAIWYWGTIAIEVTTATSVLTVAESFYPLVYVRNFLGVIFVLFLPGYVLTKALFPFNVFSGSSKPEIQRIMQIALSIGLSFALVPILSLLLFYSAIGLDIYAVLFCLLVFTFVFSTIAVIRQYQVKKTGSGVIITY